MNIENPKYRLMVYKKMLNFLCDRKYLKPGFCVALNSSITKIFHIDDFPELMAIKPKKYSLVTLWLKITGREQLWWPQSWQKLRQRKLKKIIKQLEKKHLRPLF